MTPHCTTIIMAALFLTLTAVVARAYTSRAKDTLPPIRDIGKNAATHAATKVLYPSPGSLSHKDTKRRQYKKNTAICEERFPHDSCRWWKRA